MEKRELPLSLIDIPPGEGAIRHTGIRLDGSPDGQHTGGVWFWNEEVWKPTDCLPYQNCKFRILTDEVEALIGLAGEPLFPKNWVAQESNGRCWIVRPICHIYSNDYKLSTEELLQVKGGLRNANRLHWEINDDISIGLDPDGNLFVADLSIAIYRESTAGPYAASDEGKFWKLAKEMGFDLLCDRRRAAIETSRHLSYKIIKDDWPWFPKFVYGSFYRPLDMWANKIPKTAHLVHNDRATDSIPHTWVFTDDPIDPAVVKSYELILCEEEWK